MNKKMNMRKNSISLRNLIFGLLSVVLIGLSSEVKAFEFHARCGSEGCFTDGWIVNDLFNSWLTKVDCTDGDCLHKGWTTWNANGAKTFSTCKKTDCWQYGWSEETPFGQLVADVSCRAPNHTDSQEGKTDKDIDIPQCLAKGWDAFYPGGITERTSCLNGDCRNEGWEVFRNGYLTSRVLCNTQGCFNDGWTLYQ